MIDIIEQLGGPAARASELLILDASGDAARCVAYRRLRHAEFVDRQGLFARDDTDAADLADTTRVLVAVAADGRVIGGVRLHRRDGDRELGWWQGSRLVVAGGAEQTRTGIGAALVRAACATALNLGALRFDAHVQARHERFFTRLGWETVRSIEMAGAPHTLVRWPIDRFERLVAATKAPIGSLVGGLVARDRWRGDDAVPIPGSDLVTTVDAITPSMVEQDPEWAGWCGILVTAHDLAAMGATPVGALDAIGAADVAHAARVLQGLRRASEAFDLPVLGGHTQLGVPGALAVTGFGHAADPVPAGGARPGDALTVTADLTGSWRPGYHGRQWDSTSSRTREELAAMLDTVRRCRPRAAKDVSMAGIVGTAGMLVEAGGCGAELTVASIPRPGGAGLADWLTCFPGYAVITCDRPGSGAPIAPVPGVISERCGRLTAAPGVRLRWPDGEMTTALAGAGVTGLGVAA
ncbi:MAG TPA: MSMEG_0567/sll0787 family protein [Solirubrobacteraceae bacterium]|jgi:putative N-acetyltransferase (TIGR04045 family)|nr:MSMEG_0567/sll0787 family protein [Solirubrobacteraceae bacterium]